MSSGLLGEMAEEERLARAADAEIEEAMRMCGCPRCEERFPSMSRGLSTRTRRPSCDALRMALGDDSGDRGVTVYDRKAAAYRAGLRGPELKLDRRAWLGEGRRWLGALAATTATASTAVGRCCSMRRRMRGEEEDKP